MNPTIIYTYKTPKYKILQKETDQKYWIKKSIESARKVGYINLELYTNDIEFSKDLDLDKIHLIEDDYELWDSFKIKVLETRTDDYFLCDNDVVFKNQIPFDDNIDLYFDGYETKNWYWLYQPILDDLKDKKVFDNIDIWSYDKKKVVNTGILKIENLELKSKYIDYWKLLYKMSNSFVDSYDGIGITPVISQFLLSLLIDNNRHSSKNFSGEDWNEENIYYEHHVGSKKLKSIYLI